MGPGVVDDVAKQFQAQRRQCAFPQFPGGFSFFHETPILRGDGAGIHTVDMADYKAYTALSFRTDGIDMVERAKTGNVPAAIGKLPRLVLAQGGVLIKAGDEIVGVIGVSGARGNNIDTQCARAAVDKIKDQLK